MCVSLSTDPVTGDLLLSQQWGNPGPFSHGGVAVTNLSEHFRTIIRQEIEADRERQREAARARWVDHGNGNFSMAVNGGLGGSQGNNGRPNS